MESLADLAYRVIADRLIMLDIRPNESINESQLSKEMQMGRTPIREALHRLEHERLVVTQPRKGSFAAPIDLTDLSEVGQVRQILEPVGARLAAESLREAQRPEVERYLGLVESIDEAKVDQGDLMRLDLAIHNVIYALTGNGHLEDTLRQYGHLSTRIWLLVLERRPLVVGHIRELAPILRAILAKDPERAGSLMDAHVRNFGRYIASVV
ncbi:GntR family transcriptional regulator [Sinomonas cyclohexanicum]|uniref:GntR family transcriptional regulator n=1 Tax=Sinomonas cyclohexanicum TaxID=322009 RepID=A0ABM7Q002_SINCY|nr:GntR family transcriptional regulator [Corynebacterium cyclohexanicum]BCT77660.1 GntR family transcriptional regulator [Corynebacterium cyclohexanicum]